MTIVGLIPARKNSKRVPGKNTRLLGGKPLVAWTIEAAKESGVFAEIWVCSDDDAVLEVGRQNLVDLYKRQPSSDIQPDYAWLSEIRAVAIDSFDAFAILRPTSPFRGPNLIRAAWESLQQTYGGHAPVFHSVRAVTKWEGPHPAKMWYAWGKRITCIRPCWEGTHPDGTPWHSSPTQSLKSVWKQTGGLEMAWTRVLRETNTIAGNRVHPLILGYPENIDINTEDDWQEAERIATTLARD